MNELFEYYSKRYKTEWEFENEIFYLYFNNDKSRLYISDDVVYLEKYSRLFRYWNVVTHCHPNGTDDTKCCCEMYIKRYSN